jgi:hypothetical protein
VFQLCSLSIVERSILPVSVSVYILIALGRFSALTTLERKHTNRMPFTWIPKGGAGGGLSIIVIGTAALLGYVHGKWRASLTPPVTKDANTTNTTDNAQK